LSLPPTESPSRLGALVDQDVLQEFLLQSSAMTDAIEDDDERQRAVASTRRAFALPPVVPENPPHEEDLPEACRALGLDDWRNLSLNPACPTRRYYRLPWNVRTPLRHTHGRPTFRGTARRRRLGGMPATAEALGPDAEVSLTQNPGQDTQSAAFDKVAPPPRVNFATYSHASLISFDAHNSSFLIVSHDP